MATVNELIKRALRLLGVLASGEEPEASELSDAIVTLNQMLDSWSTERLSVYGTTEQVFTWPSGEATQTIGTNGDFAGVCPVQLSAGTYFVLDGVSYTVTIINQDQYASIPVKTISTQIPVFIFPNMLISSAEPVLQMTLYPVPSQDLEFHFISVVPIAQLADGDDVYVPEGYLRAFVYNLALELAPEFGTTPSLDVRRIAGVSKRDIKRINNPNDVMNLPVALVSKHVGGDIYSGWQ